MDMQIFFRRLQAVSVRTGEKKGTDERRVAVTIKADVERIGDILRAVRPRRDPAASSLGLWVSKWVD